MAKHVHGDMDTSVQEATFAGFMKWATWVTIASILVLIFMALVNG